MSSDSSDEENLDLLIEAADFQFINDSMFNDKRTKPVISTKSVYEQEVLPSLRRSQDEYEQFNIFHVTPEFQSYVAKQLSAILEKRLEQELTTVDDIEPERKKTKSYVKLFSDSKHFLKIKDKYKVPVNPKKTNTEKDLKKKVDTEISEEILKQVAVNPEDILNKTDTKFWSNRSKSNKVFNYKRSSDGTLILVERKFE
ncbi:uncharacterized protein LOC143194285 [Rhynchophorus ferrugineus]|uniref:uncharacterized protein LOC143194285 n=1 Tax=Rhynchophorus ferrugineus TaxID=354439 RepID=UPI003FCDF01B